MLNILVFMLMVPLAGLLDAALSIENVVIIMERIIRLLNETDQKKARRVWLFAAFGIRIAGVVGLTAFLEVWWIKNIFGLLLWWVAYGLLRDLFAEKRKEDETPEDEEEHASFLSRCLTAIVWPLSQIRGIVERRVSDLAMTMITVIGLEISLSMDSVSMLFSLFKSYPLIILGVLLNVYILWYVSRKVLRLQGQMAKQEEMGKIHALVMGKIGPHLPKMKVALIVLIAGFLIWTAGGMLWVQGPLWLVMSTMVVLTVIPLVVRWRRSHQL